MRSGEVIPTSPGRDYFDVVDENIDDVGKTHGATEIGDRLLNDIEHGLVEDCTVAAEMLPRRNIWAEGEEPEALREACRLREQIHRAILDHSVMHRRGSSPGPESLSAEERAGKIMTLSRSLRAAFTEIEEWARRHDESGMFGNSPLDPVRALLARGEEERAFIDARDDPWILLCRGEDLRLARQSLCAGILREGWRVKPWHDPSPCPYAGLALLHARGRVGLPYVPEIAARVPACARDLGPEWFREAGEQIGILAEVKE